MQKRLCLLFALILAVPSLLHASEPCNPQFPLRAPWLGADAAYSIPLDGGHSVWIFGDTLYGEKRVVSGGEPQMVRNSIGISTCSNGKFDVKYVIRHDQDGAMKDFFPARKKDTWYWALDGFRHDNNLWVTLLCIRATPKATADALGFETCGADLAKVSNLAADPQRWKVDVFPLVEDGVKAYPSATTVVDGKYAYLFALYENAARPMVLGRIALNKLSEPAKNLEYLAADNSWKPGFDPKDAKVVMPHGNTEMTIRYDSVRKQWLAVMTDPQFGSDKIVLRTAKDITGPYTDAMTIYTVPDLQKSDPNYDSATFCYAGKEHPEFRGKDTLLITYACNTMNVPKLATNLSIYFPKAVRVAKPAVEAKK